MNFNKEVIDVVKDDFENQEKIGQDMQGSFDSDIVEIVTSSIFIKKSDLFERVRLSDINYVKSSGVNSVIITNTNTYYISMGVNKLLEIIDCNFIARCHKSFAINVNKVELFDNVSLKLKSKECISEIPISNTFYYELMKNFKRIK